MRGRGHYPGPDGLYDLEWEGLGLHHDELDGGLRECEACREKFPDEELRNMDAGRLCASCAKAEEEVGL